MPTLDPDAVHDVNLPLSTYQLCALRLLVQADIVRTQTKNPHTGVGPDLRDWPTAIRAIAGMLDRYVTAPDAGRAFTEHHISKIKAEQAGKEADHG